MIRLQCWFPRWWRQAWWRARRRRRWWRGRGSWWTTSPTTSSSTSGPTSPTRSSPGTSTKSSRGPQIQVGGDKHYKHYIQRIYPKKYNLKSVHCQGVSKDHGNRNINAINLHHLFRQHHHCHHPPHPHYPPGVSKIMVTGTSLHSTKEALRLTRLYPDVLYSTAGTTTTVFFATCFFTNNQILCLQFPNIPPHIFLFVIFLETPLNPIDFFLSLAKLAAITLTLLLP